MKKKLLIALAILTLGAGFYFGVFKIDPLSLLTSVGILAVNYLILSRVNETKAMVEKSHTVLAANQRQLAQKLDVLRLEVRKK